MNPNTISIPKYLPQEKFQADVDMLQKSDAVIVDVRTKNWLGVGAKMVLAKQANIPMLTLCPMESEYRGILKLDNGTEEERAHSFVSHIGTGF